MKLEERLKHSKSTTRPASAAELSGNITSVVSVMALAVGAAIASNFSSAGEQENGVTSTLSHQEQSTADIFRNAAESATIYCGENIDSLFHVFNKMITLVNTKHAQYQLDYKNLPVFSIALLMLLSSIISWLSTSAAYAAAPSQDTTTFTLVCDEVKTRLEVPTAYIDRDWTGKADQGPILYLKMLWPSMESTSVRTRLIDQQHYDEEKRFLLSGRALNIEFHQSKVPLFKSIIKHYIENDWIPLTDDEPVPGFEQYTDKANSYSVKKHWLTTKILVPVDKNYTEKVYFNCPLNSNLPHTRLYCVGHTDFGHYVYGNYQLSFANLQDWKTIDSVVRQLFDKMYAPQQQADTPHQGE